MAHKKSGIAGYLTEDQERKRAIHNIKISNKCSIEEAYRIYYGRSYNKTCIAKESTDVQERKRAIRNIKISNKCSIEEAYRIYYSRIGKQH